MQSTNNFSYLIKHILIVVLIFIFSKNIYSQTEFTQLSNNFRGKLVGIGWNPGWSSETETKVLDFNCNECDAISNTYLIAFEISQIGDIDYSSYISINNIPIFLNNSTRVGNIKSINGGDNEIGYLHLLPIELNCSNSNQSLTFSVPPNPATHGFTGYYLVIECEKNSSDIVFYDLLLNNVTNDPDFIITNINPATLNPINQTNNIGFSIVGHTFNFLNGDASDVEINGNYLGTIAGQDLSSELFFGSGVRGEFEYENGTLFGKDDDTPDNIMQATDALANIVSYLNGSSSVFFSCKHEIPNNKTNYTLATIFSYTSPCSAFPTQTSSDTTLCFGTTAQLLASGGGLGGTLPAYEWQPAVGLSCTDCPNPIVTADSSRMYTVRIRNNDSCSVVRPIKVNVKPLPEFSSVVSKPSMCGAATGQILLGADYVGETYSINGGTPQTAGTFSNLSAGTYTVSLHELNGCTRDTLVVVGDTSLTQAYFTATPQSGAAPLWVQFSNQSTNANEFSWSVNGEPQDGNLTSFSFDTNGVYTVELVAWQFDPSCADTFSVLISVYDSLVVQIPNVFTPNNDGNNDFFGVTVNRPCAISFSILNRWGNVIQSGTVPTIGGFVPLWSGSNAPDGTYFYQVELQADDLKQVEKRQGFVERM